MQRYLKFLVSVVYLILLLSRDLFCKILFHKPKGKLLVLYYHSIADEYKERFSQQLDTLGKYGKFVHVDFNEEIPRCERYFAISFDDGYKSVLKNGVPELKKRKIPYSIFFPTAHIGKEPTWQVFDEGLNPNECIMDENEIRQFDNDFVKIGSHSVNHCKLTTLTNKEQLNELRESKECLERLTKNEAVLFSIPYGAYDDGLISLAKEAGYKMIFSSDPKYSQINNGKSDFVRGRVSIDPSDSRVAFIIKILGGYNWLSKYLQIKKHRFKKAATV